MNWSSVFTTDNRAVSSGVPAAFCFVGLFLSNLLSGCSDEASLSEPVSEVSEPSGASVVLMTFNVENLFDTQDDPGKNDETYLPLLWKKSAEHRVSHENKCRAINVRKWRNQCLSWDWSDTALQHKLELLGSAILQVNEGRGPDILVLQEVENRAVVERLRSGYLAQAEYLPTVLIEGADLRGIDIAFLSRFPLAVEPRLHPIPFAGVPSEMVGDTRGILEATFTLPDGSLLTGFGVHFPAPFLPWEMRVTAYEFLNELRGALPAGRAVFAAGDFNTPAAEDRQRRLLDQYVRPYWTLAHETGCDGCRGTYYYAPKREWSFLDMILWSSGDLVEQSDWRLVQNSVSVPNRALKQQTEDGFPAGFELPGASGVSDHWPLAVRIENSGKTEG